MTSIKYSSKLLPISHHKSSMKIHSGMEKKTKNGEGSHAEKTLKFAKREKNKRISHPPWNKMDNFHPTHTDGNRNETKKFFTTPDGRDTNG